MSELTLKTNPHLPMVVIAQGSLMLFLFLLMYYSAFAGLARDWYENSTFSYGALIPFIVCYLIWTQRQDLLKIPIVPTVFGFVSLFVAVSIGVFGKAIGDSFTIRVSIVLSIAATVHFLLGKEFLKALRFPLAFLAFMIPFPYVFVKEVAYYLRFIDAAITAWFLETIGIPVFRDAYFLHLPNITLEVADLCSGISSIFALFAIGTLYAHFLPLRSAIKVLVVCSTIPFAVLVNLLRIILTSVLAYYMGPAVLSFLVHEFTGMITFFIALGLFVALGEFVQRKCIGLNGQNKAHRQRHPEPLSVRERIGASGAKARSTWTACLFACATFVVAYYFSVRLDNRVTIPLTSQLESLGERLGPYSISNRSWPNAYRDRNAEHELSRMYEGEPRGLVEFYVGYVSQQRDNKKLSSPKLTFVYGWNDLWTESTRVKIIDSNVIDATWMLIQNGSQKRLVLYWYQAGGFTFGSETSYRFNRVKRLVFTGKTNAAIIRIAVPIGEGEDIERGKEKAIEFTRHMYPEITKLLPI